MIPYNNEEQHEHEKVFLSFIKDFLAQLSAKKGDEAYLMLDDGSNYSNAWSKQDLALFLELNMEDEPYLTIDNPNKVTLRLIIALTFTNIMMGVGTELNTI